jgi:hypothetical protein
MRRRSLIVANALAIAAIGRPQRGWATVPPAAVGPVDLLLVLAADVSYSIGERELRL